MLLSKKIGSIFDLWSRKRVTDSMLSHSGQRNYHDGLLDGMMMGMIETIEVHYRTKEEIDRCIELIFGGRDHDK